MPLTTHYHCISNGTGSSRGTTGDSGQEITFTSLCSQVVSGKEPGCWLRKQKGLPDYLCSPHAPLSHRSFHFARSANGLVSLGVSTLAHVPPAPPPIDLHTRCFVGKSTPWCSYDLTSSILFTVLVCDRCFPAHPKILPAENESTDRAQIHPILPRPRGPIPPRHTCFDIQRLERALQHLCLPILPVSMGPSMLHGNIFPCCPLFPAGHATMESREQSPADL